MRREGHEVFATRFWQEAYERLPAHVRGQYLTQMKGAESWELTLGELIKVWSRAKNALLKVVHAPRATGA